MTLLVMKFGGASVATPESFALVAEIIKARKKEYSQVVVVISAMAHTTDSFLELAKKVHPNPPQREVDMLISVGERISIALLAMALSKIEVEAISFTGSQSGIITTDKHENAQIVDIRPRRILENLSQNKVIIVAGFQGMSQKGEITTLGRGGSDTSAVALAAALKAEKVEFYKDVPGIFSEDPKKSLDAVPYTFLTYEDALDIVQKGAKVLHDRAVLLARDNNIKLHVLSFNKKEDQREQFEGTLIFDPVKPSYGGNPLYEHFLTEEKTKI